jgi:hypothetical protein
VISIEEPIQMSNQDNLKYIRQYFEDNRGNYASAVAELTEDVDGFFAEVKVTFESMLPHMGYLDEDKRKHVFASAVLSCSLNMALALACQKRGVSLHEYGSKMLNGLTALLKHQQIPEGQNESVEEENAEDFVRFTNAAEQSQKSAQPGEFVFEAVSGEGEDFKWGQNIKSCAICYMASKYDVMELVPYFCATDDLISDHSRQGLNRSGTIALGAGHCDFRYGTGDKARHLSGLYPDRIRLTEES